MCGVVGNIKKYCSSDPSITLQLKWCSAVWDPYMTHTWKECEELYVIWMKVLTVIIRWSILNLAPSWIATGECQWSILNQAPSFITTEKFQFEPLFLDEAEEIVPEELLLPGGDGRTLKALTPMEKDLVWSARRSSRLWICSLKYECSLYNWNLGFDAGSYNVNNEKAKPILCLRVT